MIALKVRSACQSVRRWVQQEQLWISGDVSVQASLFFRRERRALGQDGDRDSVFVQSSF